MADALFLRLSYAALQEWLQQGVRTITADYRVETPRLEPPVAFGNFGDQPLLARLPHKYAAAVSQYSSVLALNDDLECLSLASAELTTEARMRFQKLQVTWLPFEYQSEWVASAEELAPLSPSPNGPSPVAPSEEPTLVVLAGGVAQETAGDTPADQSQRVTDPCTTASDPAGGTKSPEQSTNQGVKKQAKGARTNATPSLPLESRPANPGDATMSNMDTTASDREGGEL